MTTQICRFNLIGLRSRTLEHRTEGRARKRGSLLCDRGGAVAVYIALTAAVLFGMVGVALDLGRFGITNTDAQHAADAAALAAASQLDGQSDAITRATNAAQTTPLVQNSQKFASSGGGTVTIASMRFLSSLPGLPGDPGDDSTPIPSGDVTTDPTQARFVEVTTEGVAHQNWFIEAVGGPASATTSAKAVAGMTQAICRITPLGICNPQEAAPPVGEGSGAPFDIDQWKGKMVQAKPAPTSGPWAPGDFGFLQTPNCNPGASCLKDEFASVNPLTSCVSTQVSTRPGQVTSVDSAVNTRFDMWQNPGFNGASAMGNADYAPAIDVVKGLIPDNGCNNWNPPPGQYMAIPRDQSFSGLIGNGIWDCQTYWNINHSGATPPANCTSTTNAATYSRWQMYQDEIANNQIPNNLGKTPPGEQGNASINPQRNGSDGVCYTGGSSTLQGATRRILYFAVLDCVRDGITGSKDDINPVAFVKGFITEPVSNPGDGPTIYLEIEDVAKVGADDGVLHDIVQLYR